MHVCFSIPEILTIICDQIAPSANAYSEDRATLAVLARTSRIFYEPALNALWSRLRTITPLLALQSDAWQEREVLGGLTMLTVRRPIVPTDWVRFHHHAKRVRILDFPDTNDLRVQEPIIDLSVYRTLSLAKQATPLLPNLRSLFWGKRSGGLEYIRIFIGRDTHCISLSLGLLDIAEQSLLGSIPALLPNLVQITINCAEISDTITTTLSNVVCGYNRLKCASFGAPLTREALLHLRDMPVLRDLTLTIERDNENFQYLAHSSYSPFSALRILAIRCRNISSSNMLLNAIPWHQIESVHVQLTAALGPATTIQAFFQTLRSQCSNRLESIQITFHTLPVMYSSDRYVIDEDMFNPLLSFQHLTTLTILTCHGFQIGNDVLHKMAMSWPRLQVLKLGVSSWVGRSKITLAGLVPLAQHCVNLISLNIIVDATTVDPPVHIPTPNIKLRHLHLRDSKIQDPASVAAYLSGLFPSIIAIFSWSPTTISERPPASIRETKQYKDRWDEVARLIPIFASVRQVGR